MEDLVPDAGGVGNGEDVIVAEDTAPGGIDQTTKGTRGDSPIADGNAASRGRETRLSGRSQVVKSHEHAFGAQALDLGRSLKVLWPDPRGHRCAGRRHRRRSLQHGA